MVKMQFNELEIFCLLQALKVVETKDNIEREKLSVVFKQLRLLEFNSSFNKNPNRPLFELASSKTEDFDVEDFVPQYIFDATNSVSVKGPFELSMAMMEVTNKAKALLPAQPPVEGKK